MSGRFRVLVPAVIALTCGAGPVEVGTGHGAAVQDGEPTPEAAVRERVERMLWLTGRLRYYALPGYFTKNANIVRIERRRNGVDSWVETAEQWIASLEARPGWVPHEERLSNVSITIESGALAFLKADFQIFRGPELRSHGFQVFTLIKQDGPDEPDGQDGDWKIASIAFTTFADWAQ